MPNDTTKHPGDLTGTGALGGTDLTGATGGTSTASGAEEGSGIPIAPGRGDTGDAGPGVADRTANRAEERLTRETGENDEKGNG